MVGYWPFNGNANDESGNGNNGTVNGAILSADRFGNSNQAYNLNGVSDYIIIQNNSSLNVTLWSISAWVNPNGYNTGNANYIVGKGDDSNQGHYSLHFKSISKKARPSSGFGSTGLYTDSYSNININNWVHITGSWDGNTMKVYVNGVLEDSIINPNHIQGTNSQDLFFGTMAVNNSFPYWLNGKIDDISIYNRALTPAEIVQLYTDQTSQVEIPCTAFLGEDQTVCAGTSVTLSASGSSLACPTLPSTLQNGLVGYWPFCGNANDASGNGNNGTVNGATLTTDRFGNANEAYSFDGVNDYIVTNNISFANGGDYSISLWVKLIVAYSDGHPQHYLLSNATTLGGAYINTDYNQSQFGCNSFYSDNSIGNWHNYVGIKSGNTYTLRIDNQVVGSVSNCNTNFINGYPIFFGNSSVNTEFANGIIDDISIYTRALSVSEIQQLYTLGQTTYLWSNGATTATINVTPTTTTTYTCTVTTNGVSCTDDITVVVSQPVASITPNGIVEICQGQSIALTANGGTSYFWNTNAPTQSITVNTEGLYTVTATDANGCTDTESQLVKVNFLPNIAVNNSAICEGQSATLTATGGLSYVWSPATGLSATTGSTVTSSTTTNTVYTVTGTSINGCTNTATAAVAVNALPAATITPATATTVCQGGGVVLNANTGAGLSYQWFNNAVAISGETSSIYIANTSGSYTVIVTSTTTCSSTSNSIDVTTVANVNYFADADGDGFGDAATLVSTCVQPQGYVTDNTDCNDSDSNVNTAATEVCNEIDDDCNGLTDDGLVFETYYADNDGDNDGDANNSIYECSQPSGYVTDNNDCNDNNANQNAASSEICNGEDDDCDGAIDNGITFLDYYADADGDGFGAGDVLSSCTDLGSGYTDNNTDCDDANAGVYPSAEELCNSIDDNCDGLTDDGTLTVYFIDNDGDTYGNPSVSILACTQPIGYTPDDTDCNDTDANINPGAEDIGGNGIDENCDGQIDNSIYELNSTIALYPNPTSSELNIQINSSIIGNDLFIFDAVGKIVYKQQLLSTQTTIPVSNFADGNYVVRVGEVVKRFVIQH